MASKGGEAKLHVGQSLRGRKRVSAFIGRPFYGCKRSLTWPVRMLNRPPLKVLIAAPRGFCAGVDRAIQIVELALERFGAPVYVRHEIVHNRFVVDRLRGLGAVFVDELDEVPDDRPVVFSAHGVPKSVPAEAQQPRPHLCRCDLPAGVEGPPPGAAADRGRTPHPLHRPCRPPRGDRHLRPGAGRARSRWSRRSTTSPSSSVPSRANLAFLTQTTLSVDDTAAIVEALKARFPGDPRAAQRGYLLRDLEPAGGGQGDRRRMRPDAGHRRAQQQQFAAARRGRRADGRAGAPDRARRRHRLGLARRARRRSD